MPCAQAKHRGRAAHIIDIDWSQLVHGPAHTMRLRQELVAPVAALGCGLLTCCKTTRKGLATLHLDLHLHTAYPAGRCN